MKRIPASPTSRPPGEGQGTPPSGGDAMAGETDARAGRRWRRWAIPVLAIALLLVAASGHASLATPDNVHPAIYDWARSHPGDPVPVVVRAKGDTAAAVHVIESAGGRAGRQFSIVSAVEAELPAASIASVAASPAVAFLSLDAPVESTDTVKVDTKALSTTYPISVNANDPWSKGYTGAGVTVAVVDTGVSPKDRADFIAPDGSTRVVAEVAVNPSASGTRDGFGHGTHVAGIVGGFKPKGKYVGIAPEASFINVKVADDTGLSTIADAIAGLQWVYENQAQYNIRVVNLSLHSSVPESYRSSPLDAAVEALWFKGVFVVVAAGNLGGAPDAVFYPPANDPFVMTVGAIDDKATTNYGDDVPTPWSSYGTTQDGFAKPELLTPGRSIVSTIDPGSYLYAAYPAKIVDTNYFSLSGTSMAAGVMSGVAALVLERHPDWKPGELKCSLVSTSRALAKPYQTWKVPRAGAASNLSAPACNSDIGIAPSTALAPMLKAGVVAFVAGSADQAAAGTAIGFDVNAIGGSGTDLNDLDWSAIKWDAITWSAIKWDAIKWDAIKWDAIKWDAIKWDAVTPDGVNFSAITWSAIKWDAITWSAITWSSIKWDAIKWDAIKWDAIKWDMVAE